MSAEMLTLALLSGGLAAASATLSAIETAMFSMNQERRRKLRVKDARRAALLDDLLARPDEVGSALVLANTLTNLPLLVLILFGAQHAGLAEDWSVWAVLGFVFAVVVVTCDLLPKMVALAAPIRTTRLGLPLVKMLIPVMEPVCAVLRRWSERLVGRITPARMAPLPHLTDEELETLVEIGRAEGTFDEFEGRLLREVMKLGEESARHCMTPRVDLFTLPDDLSNEDAAQILRRKRYRRVPVRGETPDDILGILDVAEFLLHPGRPHYTERLQPPSFVPETMNALDLLRAFLNHRQHFAILLDEYGGIEGLVTLSDIVEELLGEEGPDARNELYIEPLGGGRLLVAGVARLDDLAEHVTLTPEAADVETIGGLVVAHFGSMPRPGDSFVQDGRRITVRRATRKRIKEVLIEAASDGEEGGA